MADRRRHRWSARLAAAIGLLALPAAAGVLFLTGSEDEIDAEATLVQELSADGERADVIECVLRLAARDLRTGPLDQAARDELVTGCRAARDGAVDPTAYEPPENLASVDHGPSTFGDDLALDALWRSCEEGSGAACDQLFRDAPVGTAYEAFGLSCGDRPDVLHCAELDIDPTTEGTDGTDAQG